MRCKWNYAAYVKAIMPEANCIWRERAVPCSDAMSYNCLLLLIIERFMRCRAFIGAGKYLLTVRRKYDYISHGQKQTLKLKSRKPPAPGQPQPPSGKSCRPAVCHLRFFRPARPRSGQIRDDTQGSGGQPNRQWQRSVLRVFPTLFLSGAGSAQARRPSRLGSAKAWAAAQAQAQRRGNGVRRKTEVGRSITASARADTSYPGSLWQEGSCAQCRAGARAPEKKTALIGPNPFADDGAAAAYEALRGHILAGSPGRQHFGLILLLREGVAVWLERRSTAENTAAKFTRPDTSASKSLITEPLQAELVSVLAGIALIDRKEMRA